MFHVKPIACKDNGGTGAAVEPMWTDYIDNLWEVRQDLSASAALISGAKPQYKSYSLKPAILLVYAYQFPFNI